MRDRLTAVRDRLGFAELAIVGVVLFAFLIGGVIGGTPVTIFRTCSGMLQAECPPDKWVQLNPTAGLFSAASAVLLLIVIDRVMRLRAR